MTEIGVRPFLTLSLAVLAIVQMGCSGGGAGSGSGGSSGGGTGGSNPGGTAPFKPCAAEMEVGAFTLELKTGEAGAASYSQVTGSIRDGVRPDTIWVPQAVSGAGSECKLVVGPTNSCPTSCNADLVCKGNTCVTAPVNKSIGEITFSGLVVPVKMTPMRSGSGSVVYTGLIDSKTPFPPYTVGDKLEMTAAGEDYPGFMLSGVGIKPLEVEAGQTLLVKKDQALTIKWVKPPAVGGGRIELAMDIAHHGGVAAEIQCDLPDTGSVTIPAPLINALLEKGAFGFPMVTLTRVSTDSRTVGPGCLEFNVAASVAIPLDVDGVVSCTDNSACTPPQVCLTPGYKCGMM